MKRRLQKYGEAVYQQLLAGHSEDSDMQRREFILNVLLSGIILASALASLFAIIDSLNNSDIHQGNSLFNIMVLMAVTLGLWRLSKSGRHQLAAYIFLGCLSIVALNLVLHWSFELPMAEISCALLVVIAGLILKPRAALEITVAAIISLLIIAHAQAFGVLHPDVNWLHKRLEWSNAADDGLMLSMIGLVSYLASLEMARSLKRAKHTEAALAAERDSLETRVMQRTRELEQMQAARLTELQRLAEFGRLSAQLLHEVANPLTAASLHLEHIGQQSLALRQARKNLHQLERYIDAARKQLKNGSQQTLFSVLPELRQQVSVLRPLAQKAQVQLVIEATEPMKLFGDPVLFNQIVANLVVNAIDAYADTEQSAHKRVVVSLYPVGDCLHVTVRDWGNGINPDQMPHLFEPFYTTKPNTVRGLGLGLSIVKQSVESEFSGSIRVTSSSSRGTAFHVKLRLQPTTNTLRHYPALTARTA